MTPWDYLLLIVIVLVFGAIVVTAINVVKAS
jgi:hypothetical protein